MSDSYLFEENKNNNEYQKREILTKNDILALVEKAQLDRDRAISNYTNIKINYNSLQNDYNSLQSKITSLEIDLKKAISKSSFAESKLNENISKLFSTEKKLSEITIQKDILSQTNNLLENQLSQHKNAYTDFKTRTNKEISLLKSNLEEIQKEKEELMNNNFIIKKELNQYKLKNKLLEKENETIKSDNDNLIKIIEEHNDIVKTSEARISSFDNTVNEYKKQIDNLNLEIEKLKLENKLQNEYNDKFKNFFNEKILISDNTFEEALNNIRNNYKKKLNIKINEYNLLRTNYINVKIERDKFGMDYSMLKEDYKQNNERYQNQYLELKEEKKIKENEMNKEIGYLNDKINALLEENLKLKNENNDLENKIKELKVEEDLREKLEQKNKEINNEVNKINKKNDELIQENEMLKNKLNELLENDEK